MNVKRFIKPLLIYVFGDMGNRVSVHGNNNSVYIGSGKERTTKNSCSDFADTKKSREVTDSVSTKPDEDFKVKKVNSTKQNSQRDRKRSHNREKTQSLDRNVDFDKTNVKHVERDSDETKPFKTFCPNASFLSGVFRALSSCTTPTKEQENSDDVEGADNPGYVAENSCPINDETLTDPVNDSNIEMKMSPRRLKHSTNTQQKKNQTLLPRKKIFQKTQKRFKKIFLKLLWTSYL